MNLRGTNARGISITKDQGELRTLIGNFLPMADGKNSYQFAMAEWVLGLRHRFKDKFMCRFKGQI